MVDYPRNIIQFLNYGYSLYIKKVLELVEINPDKIEWRLYEKWTLIRPLTKSWKKLPNY
jgi:hypothetical protein